MRLNFRSRRLARHGVGRQVVRETQVLTEQLEDADADDEDSASSCTVLSQSPVREILETQ